MTKFNEKLELNQSDLDFDCKAYALVLNDLYSDALTNVPAEKITSFLREIDERRSYMLELYQDSLSEAIKRFFMYRYVVNLIIGYSLQYDLNAIHYINRI